MPFCKIGVLFGSETGTAEEVAHRVATEILLLSSRKNGNNNIPKISILPIDESLSSSNFSTYAEQWKSNFDLIIFIIATAGNGDPPRTMRKMWKQLLLRNQSKNTLDGLKFCVFGLGDSTYPRFNYMAKMFHNRLSLGLGAEAVLHRALGDDEDPQGYESELRPFLGELYSEVLELVDKEKFYKTEFEEIHELNEKKMDLEEELQDAVEDDEDGEEVCEELEKNIEEVEEKIHEIYGTRIDVDKNELAEFKTSSLSPINSNEDLPNFLLSNVSISKRLQQQEQQDQDHNNIHHHQLRRERENSSMSTGGTSGNQEDADNIHHENQNQERKLCSVEEYLQNRLHLRKFKVTRNERVTSKEHFQDVRNIELVSSSSQQQYETENTPASVHPSNNEQQQPNYLPGDTFAMYPRNQEVAVKMMLDALELSPENDIITISSSSSSSSSSSVSFHQTPQQPFYSSSSSFTAQDFFTWVVDLQAATPRQLLWQFSFWVDRSFKESANFDGEEIYDRLMQLSRYSMDDYMEYATRERRPVCETLQEFLPILNNRPVNWRSVIISYLKPIAVRHFSICRFDDSSSGSKKEEELLIAELLVAIHKVTTPMKRQRIGLCSSYIQDFLSFASRGADDLSSEDCAERSSGNVSSSSNYYCYGFIERNVHTLPVVNNTTSSSYENMILVGPGTGIAPIRAVIQKIVSSSIWKKSRSTANEDEHQQNTNNNKNKNILVFTGHRHPEKDYPFGHEWKTIEDNENNNNIQFFHAFSRFKPSSNNNSETATNKNAVVSYPKYVQQAMTQNQDTKQQIAKILSCSSSSSNQQQQQPTIIISGNAKQMPKDVHTALCQCLVESKVDESMAAADKRLEKLRQSGRYVVDAWA